MDLVIAVDFGPSLLVFDIDVLIAEYPAETHGDAAGRGGRVVGGTEVEARARAYSVQRVTAASADSRNRLGYILLRCLAVAPRVSNLTEKRQCVTGVPVAVEVDEVCSGAFVRT